MTTREFIEMLQKEDPSGEGHLRMSGGVPKFAESKPGYWDGPYQYIDAEGNFVTSINGYKVDIHCVDIEDYAMDLADRDENQKWEDIEGKFKFEFGGYANKNQRDEKIQSYIERAREAWEQMMRIQKTHYDRALSEMIANSEKGWSWFQNKLIDTEGGRHHYYSWKVYNENGKEEGSNVWNTESVQKSGEWIKTDNDVLHGYYQWIRKGMENKKPNLPLPKKIKLHRRIKNFLGIK